jgi:predicted membrane-bound mannosyltransferase
MRKLVIPILLTSGLAISGCAAVLPMVLSTAVSQGVGAAVGAAKRSGQSAIPPQQLQEATVSTCTQQSSQHGQAAVKTVQQISSGTIRANGVIAANGSYPQRSFTCTYRSDGRITDFRLG